MLQGPERVALLTLVFGLTGTSVLIARQLSNEKTTLAEVAHNVLFMYKYQIICLILTILVALTAAYTFQKKSYQKKEVTLKCTNKISTDEYEKAKKVLTDDAVKKLVESEAYMKYLEDKNNNRLRNVELDDSDRIVLSDDSSIIEEDEKGLMRH